MKRFLWVLPVIWIWPAFAQEDAGADYIRFEEKDDGTSSLKTAVVRFEKAGTVVDLVSVVHLADPEYYDRMNGLLANYDSVLYEMVGGKYTPGQTGETIEGMPDVRGLQQMATTFLDLEFQLEGIDYSAPNFVHADVDWEEYQELMVAKNQTFATLFSRAMSLAQDGDIEGLPTDEVDLSMLLGSVITAIRTGDGSSLKRSFAPMLGESEDFITKIEGEDGTVLVTERNRVVLRKLEEEMEAKRPGMFAIFYGGGHMPDLEAQLLADGFQKEAVVWIDAWAMEANSEDSAEVGSEVLENPGDFLLNLLGQNPEVIEMLQQLGTVLEGIEAQE